MDQPITYTRKKYGIIIWATVRWTSGVECMDTNNELKVLEWEQVNTTGTVEITGINQTVIDRSKIENILKYMSNISNMEFGNYKINLKTRLYEVPIDHTAYIRIVKEKLHVYIVGDTYRAVRYQVDTKDGNKVRVHNNFTVDASKSNDPNIQDQSGLQFEWSCRVVSKSPSELVGSDLKCKSLIFVKMVGETGSVLRLSTSGFVISTTYEFRVKMTSAGESEMYVQKIEFVPGSPPELILK